MASYDIHKLKKLRSYTKLSVISCKKALIASGNDTERALSFLKNSNSLGGAGSDLGNKEGFVYSYVHYNNKLGVLLNLGCKTDFATKSECFLELSKKLCVHIASTNPLYTRVSSINVGFLHKLKRDIVKGFIIKTRKPLSYIAKNCIFKLADWLKKNCFMEQEFVMDTKITIKNLVEECSKLLGESITLKKYTRYSIKN